MVFKIKKLLELQIFLQIANVINDYWKVKKNDVSVEFRCEPIRICYFNNL